MYRRMHSHWLDRLWRLRLHGGSMIGWERNILSWRVKWHKCHFPTPYFTFGSKSSRNSKVYFINLIELDCSAGIFLLFKECNRSARNSFVLLRMKSLFGECFCYFRNVFVTHFVLCALRALCLQVCILKV